MSTNVLPGGPDPDIAAAVAAASLDAYPDPEARKARAKLGDVWRIDPRRILLAPGASELIYRIARCWVSDGTPVVIAGPTFGEYARAARLHGGRAYEVRARRPTLRVDLDELRSTVARLRPALVFLCSPNNPTGHAVDVDAIAEFAHSLPAGTLLVLDESYRTFAEGRLAPPHRPGEDRILHLRSFTKDLAIPGLRIAAAVGAPALLETLRRAGPPWAVSAPALAALHAGLEPAVLARLGARWAELGRGRDALTHALTARGWDVLPSQTGFVLARADTAPLVSRRLREAGVRVRDTRSFGLPDHVRFAAPRSDALPILVEALDALDVGAPGPDTVQPTARDRLLLVRHGSTDANRAGRFQGWSDPPLADIGVSEVAQASAQLGPLPASTRVWCSDLTRAVHTAARLVPDSVIHLDRRLRELSFGAFEGQTHEELSTGPSAEYAAWLADPEASPPPGGERLSELRARLFEWWADQAHDLSGRTLVVAHGGPLGVLLSELLMDSDPHRDAVPPPGGFLELQRRSGEVHWHVIHTYQPSVRTEA
ncbi:MAG: aminotransferase class I/II-fold pyridoxal phosphate-dependent enzyme [Gemmatimonadota bacterium]